MNKEKELSKAIIICFIATMETRIRTSVNINLFDRALILADLLDISKEEALETMLEMRGERTK